VCVCDINIIHAARGICVSIIIIIIMIYTEDDETYLMACLDDKVISDLTRCEPFISTPKATVYMLNIIIYERAHNTREVGIYEEYHCCNPSSRRKGCAA